MKDTHPLERMQLVLSAVRRAGGRMRLSDLQKRVGLPREAILDAVEGLRMVHAGDELYSYVDIDVDLDLSPEWVDLEPKLDQGLGRRPLPLTAAEVCALGFAVRTIQGGPDPDLARAAGRALKAVLRGAADRPRPLPVAPAEGGDPIVELLDAAIRQRQELEIDYLSASRDEATTRRIRPVVLAHRDGRWYAQADCLLRGDRRFFRADRIARAVPTGRTFAPIQPGPDEVPAAPPAPYHAEIRFDPQVAGWVRERFPGPDVRDLPDGAVVVRVPCSSPLFLASWVLSFAGRASVLSPPELRTEVRVRVDAAFGPAEPRPAH